MIREALILVVLFIGLAASKQLHTGEVPTVRVEAIQEAQLPKLALPIDCDRGWIAQWGPGEIAMKRCVDTDFRTEVQ